MSDNPVRRLTATLGGPLDMKLLDGTLGSITAPRTAKMFKDDLTKEAEVAYDFLREHAPHFLTPASGYKHHLETQGLRAELDSTRAARDSLQAELTAARDTLNAVLDREIEAWDGEPPPPRRRPR